MSPGRAQKRPRSSLAATRCLGVPECKEIWMWSEIVFPLLPMAQGEALSSLCFVARVSIVTRCRSADFATRIFFDQNGKQIAREATAREVNKADWLSVGRVSNNSILVIGRVVQRCFCNLGILALSARTHASKDHFIHYGQREARTSSPTQLQVVTCAATSGWHDSQR